MKIAVSKENGRIGIIETLDRFDHSFFGVTRKQAEMMNTSERILLEKVFEAIIDAGKSNLSARHGSR